MMFPSAGLGPNREMIECRLIDIRGSVFFCRVRAA